MVKTVGNYMVETSKEARIEMYTEVDVAANDIYNRGLPLTKEGVLENSCLTEEDLDFLHMHVFLDHYPEMNRHLLDLMDSPPEVLALVVRYLDEIIEYLDDQTEMLVSELVRSMTELKWTREASYCMGKIVEDVVRNEKEKEKY